VYNPFINTPSRWLSQAEFHLAPLGSQESGETAGVLDLLAHASIDVSHDSAALSPAVAPNPSRPQRPSTLERLRELAHLLVGAPPACNRPATALQPPAACSPNGCISIPGRSQAARLPAH
tara:strand:+ start:160 stop:519 length:360 start_codon:yes stop_codon:yes gene_type:complete